MQATNSKKVRPRPNLATADEVNALYAQLKAEIDQLRLELETLKQQPPASSTNSAHVMSPKMRERWEAMAAARDRLKAGEAAATVQAFLAAQYPTLGAEGYSRLR
jgi:hypothetical protein